MTLLEAVKSSNEKYVYIHFFQGSDLPIKCNKEIQEFFEKNEGREFVSIEYGREKMAENKCQYYHLFCHNRFFRKNRAVKAVNFGLLAIQKKMGIKKNTDINLYQGSALFSITPQFAAYLLERKNEIRSRFRFALAADECFIQSMIMKSPFKNCLYVKDGSPINARLIDRTRPDGKNSPHIWRDNELEFLLEQPEELCFSRKFDVSIAPNVVEQLKESCSELL